MVVPAREPASLGTSHESARLYNWRVRRGDGHQVGHKALGHESAGGQRWAWLGGSYGAQALAGFGAIAAACEQVLDILQGPPCQLLANLETALIAIYHTYCYIILISTYCYIYVCIDNTSVKCYIQCYITHNESIQLIMYYNNMNI